MDSNANSKESIGTQIFNSAFKIFGSIFTPPDPSQTTKGIRKSSRLSEKIVTKLMIKNGLVTNEDWATIADVYVENDKIINIGKGLPIPPNTKVYDAEGKFVMPGGIDMFCKFETEFKTIQTVDDFYNGSRAALAGGTTSIVNEIIISRGESLIEKLDSLKKSAEQNCCSNFAFRICISYWDNAIAEEMAILCKTKGISLYKLTEQPDTMDGLHLLNSCLEKSKELKAILFFNMEQGQKIYDKSNEAFGLGTTCPDGHLKGRPIEFEVEATLKAIATANQLESPIVISPVMNEDVARIISTAKHEGIIVFGETMAAALGVDGSQQFSADFDEAAGYITSPPLRSDKSTPDVLMNHLANDTFQMTGSGHCSFTEEQKAVGASDFRDIPHGVNGVEERMSIIWQKGVNLGKMDPCRFVAVTSSSAAKILNIYPTKGRIAIGSDADIIIWDPKVEKDLSVRNQHSKNDFNIFEGIKVQGAPEVVILGGTIVVEDAELLLPAQQRSGKFIPSPCNSPYIYGRLNKSVIDYVNEPSQTDSHTDIAEKKDTVKENIFGAIPGVKVGMTWPTRQECRLSQVHRPNTANVGHGPNGVYSIALSSIPCVDFGETFTIDISENDKKTSATIIERLHRNLISGHAVRVIRSFSLISQYAPSTGYRYDGLYVVKEAKKEVDQRWKVGFKRCEGQLPPPWEIA